MLTESGSRALNLYTILPLKNYFFLSTEEIMFNLTFEGQGGVNQEREKMKKLQEGIACARCGLRGHPAAQEGASIHPGSILR